MHKSNQTTRISRWLLLRIGDIRMQHPLLWVGARLWGTNPRRSCHQVGSYIDYDVITTHGCGRLYGLQYFGGKITRSPLLHHIWQGVGNIAGTWKPGSWNPGTCLVVAQCTTWLQYLWGCIGIALAWSNNLQCCLMSTIDEMSWYGFGGTSLPSLQTWECLREVWAWEAKFFYGG